MDFKEILQEDIQNTFLDTSEFAEFHDFNGRQVKLIIDDDSLSGTDVKIYGTAQRINDGLFGGERILYVSTEDTKEPPPGSALRLDGIRYTVISTSEESGMYRIIVKRTAGR